MTTPEDSVSCKADLLLDRWQFAEVPIDLPLDQLDQVDHWLEVLVPTTIAKIRGRRDGNAERFVFRCQFTAPQGSNAYSLIFEGLATLCVISLDGQVLLRTENMFREYSIALDGHPGELHELVLDFLPLDSQLLLKRPRPRWKTRLIDKQNLRWARTTLLGRMPGWAPGGGAIGPFRPVRLLARGKHLLRSHLITGTFEKGAGELLIQATIASTQALTVELELFELDGSTSVFAIPIDRKDSETLQVSHTVALEKVSPWWPHTHGRPCLYAYRLILKSDTEELVNEGRVGFKSVSFEWETAPEFRVNDRNVFCRGAIWTPLDLDSLSGDETEYLTALTLVRDAGMNMLRLSGTTIYEDPCFYRICDELGIMVWQDFMFANMDYPHQDEAFIGEVRAEAENFFHTLGGATCLSVLCGGSEVAQQAAMMGLAKQEWLSSLFSKELAEKCARYRPDVPYVANTPLGGTLPFHTDEGVSHYYGVGAYLRSLSDVQLSRPKFASECLAFSNVPTEESLFRTFAANEIMPHHPKFKAGVARDSGVGWDFADVTDHYLEVLFSEKSSELRYRDPLRYLELARITPGEIMGPSLSYLRTQGSACSGALVWLLKDLLPGAGWGVIDCHLSPKPVYYYVKRALQAQSIHLVDRGLNGIDAFVINDCEAPMSGTLVIRSFRDATTEVSSVEVPVRVDGGSQWSQNIEKAFGRFCDPSFAYKFGPPQVAAVALEFRPTKSEVATLFSSHFPIGLQVLKTNDLGLTAIARKSEDDCYELVLETQQFAHALCISIPGYQASDNYFHLPPKSRRSVTMTPVTRAQRFSGFVKAANCSKAARVALEP